MQNHHRHHPPHQKQQATVASNNNMIMNLLRMNKIRPVIDYSNEEICEKILLDQSEEIYDKMVQDVTNKTISDVASDDSESWSSLLPWFPPSNEEQQSHVR